MASNGPTASTSADSVEQSTTWRHFSIFDPIEGDLGKRKRKVKNYSKFSKTGKISRNSSPVKKSRTSKKKSTTIHVPPAPLEKLPSPKQNGAPPKKRRRRSSRRQTANVTIETNEAPQLDATLPPPPTVPPLINAEPISTNKVDSGFIDRDGKHIMIENDTHEQGWRCPMNCGKTFRDESLLKLHFKHSHHELKDTNTKGNVDIVPLSGGKPRHFSTSNLQTGQGPATRRPGRPKGSGRKRKRYSGLKKPPTRGTGQKKAKKKVVSILNRISSGRMRVIVGAVNQRSLKRKRFRAARRGRDASAKNSIIHCVCGDKSEFGFMIQCELCLRWQHGDCYNVQSNSQLPDFYACKWCSEPENVRHSRRCEWAEQEFYKHGKIPSFTFAPAFSKEDARTMKQCTNLSANLMEVSAMIQGLKIKERICFAQPENPQLSEWSTERQTPQEEARNDHFRKYFKPVLRRLLLENKPDPTFPTKLKEAAESRMELRKYSVAVASAKSTLKKKLGCSTAVFLNHICDDVLSFMVKQKRDSKNPGSVNKGDCDFTKRSVAKKAYLRLQAMKMQNELKNSSRDGRQEKKTTAKMSWAEGAASSQTSNGAKRDSSKNVEDFWLLEKYLRERRVVDNIGRTLIHMSNKFPDDWKRLMKKSRAFIDENMRGYLQEPEFIWIACVVMTYNTLRVLCRQIYSENNAQKQSGLCLEFDRTTVKFWNLIGNGVEEQQVKTQGQNASTWQRNSVQGLQTLDMLRQSTLSEYFNSKGPESTTSHPHSKEMFQRARTVDGRIALEFNDNVHLCDAVRFAAKIPEDECTEENLSLVFPEIESHTLPSNYSGIIPVPAEPRIPPEVLKKSLVRQILLEQEQVDGYMDAIEAEILKLESSQNANGETVTRMTTRQLSAQRTNMIHSLKLVQRLSKTMVGENDSEASVNRDHAAHLSSESDECGETSDYSGTETLTADENETNNYYDL